MRLEVSLPSWIILVPLIAEPVSTCVQLILALRPRQSPRLVTKHSENGPHSGAKPGRCRGLSLQARAPRGGAAAEVAQHTNLYDRLSKWRRNQVMALVVCDSEVTHERSTMEPGLTKAKTMTGRRASQPGQTRPQPNGRASPKRASVDFPVVALGASAGGLDAFKKVFDALPANSGMAFVLIQHLDPTHESLMVDLLTGHTPMKVLQATDRMQLARDRVYLIPPGAYLAIEDGTLRLSKPRERHGARMPFDFFLRWLA